MAQQDIHPSSGPSSPETIQGQSSGETPSPKEAEDPVADCSQSPLPAKALSGRTGLYYRVVDWLLRHQGSPHAVALGFALGVFVALTPTVGFQMILGATIAHFFRANRVIAAAMAWITNPATIVPIYYFNYRVGLMLVGGDPDKGRHFIESLRNVSLLNLGRFLDTMGAMLHDFADIAGVLWLGSIIVGVVCAAISYPIVRRIVEVERCKLAALQEKVARKAGL